jgi:hypothetical protein
MAEQFSFSWIEVAPASALKLASIVENGAHSSVKTVKEISVKNIDE